MGRPTFEETEALQAQLTEQLKVAADIPSPPFDLPLPDLEAGGELIVITWPGGFCDGLLISKDEKGLWMRTRGQSNEVPDHVCVCPGLDGSPTTDLAVRSRFVFSDMSLLRLRTK